jgi:cystathionine gamma-synthase
MQTTNALRFFIHLSIQRLADEILQKYATSKERAILLPSSKSAERFVSFIVQYAKGLPSNSIHVLQLCPHNIVPEKIPDLQYISPNIWACIFPKEHLDIGKQFWQHTGEGISSRRADYCHSLLTAGILTCRRNGQDVDDDVRKGPRRYQKKLSTDRVRSLSSHDNDARVSDSADFSGYVEQRFGRNLDVSLYSNAKSAIKKRIAGSLTAEKDAKELGEPSKELREQEKIRGLSADNVYLYPTGMSAIFNTHQGLLATFGSKKSVCFGFVHCGFSLRIH